MEIQNDPLAMPDNILSEKNFKQVRQEFIGKFFGNKGQETGDVIAELTTCGIRFAVRKWFFRKIYFAEVQFHGQVFDFLKNTFCIYNKSPERECKLAEAAKHIENKYGLKGMLHRKGYFIDESNYAIKDPI